jgi:RNA polymerase sigma factor (sigma-70 family)
MDVELEDLFLRSLETIETIVMYIGRANHLDASETEEFASQVKLELIDANYAIVRKFEGRSSFPTYLSTVIQRMFYQYRVKQWGKWRPSAEARRLGDRAITLERLTTRDGLTFGEALRTMTTGTGRRCSATELEAIHTRLPPRQPRPVLVSGDVSPDAAMVEADADDRVTARERTRLATDTAKALDRFIDAADSEDQVILRMRFWNMRRVPEIASALQLDPRKVYKRIERLLQRMRTALEAAGISRAEVVEMLNRGDLEISIGGGGNTAPRPSQEETSEEIRGDGESRRMR